jgi:rod shape-determining protein MreD
MADTRVTPHEILLPVKPGFIAATLVAALLMNLLPWSGYALAIKPDFVALVVLYWCIETPRRVGFLAAWLLGLLMDVADGTLFGQHALAYSLLAYAGIVLHRRVRMFALTAQVLHIIALLLMTSVVVLTIRALAGSEFPGFVYFAGSFIGGALWPLMVALFRMPQRPQPDPDHA